MIREVDYRGVEPDRDDERSLAWRLRRPVVPAFKAAARAWGSATASARCLPDYLIVGGKRSGSTTLARNLAAADDVLPLFPRREDRKGIYGFDVHFDRGARWYRSHFPLERTRSRAEQRLGRRVVVGEASPWYLQHPHAPARARELVPDARVIAVLRDPIERAHSHWRERVRQGIETITSFDEALDAEARRVDGEMERMVADPSYVSLAHLNYGYAAQSRYGDAVDRWVDAYGTEQVLVLSSARLFSEPEQVVADVRDFLGLASIEVPDSAHFNRLPGQPLPAATIDRLHAAVADDRSYVARWIDLGEWSQ